jgi:hypothetical protein
VEIFASKTLNGQRATVFDIDQVLHAEKSLHEWAVTFCQEYFDTTADSANAFFINALDFDYCVELTSYSINMSTIEHAIRH